MEDKKPTELTTGSQIKEIYSERDKYRLLLQDFQRRLNAEPDPREFQDTPDGKAKTLPISFVQMTLDEIYLGQWEVSEPSFQQIFNEVVGCAVLTVIHPVTDRPIRRTGWASVVITQDKDAAMAEFNTTKKKNALDLAFPKLGAEILKNAAQSLGKVFGRDINRKHKDVFKPALQPLSEEGFLAALKRIEGGRLETMALCEANFILTDLQREMLFGAQPETTKQIAQ